MYSLSVTSNDVRDEELTSEASTPALLDPNQSDEAFLLSLLSEIVRKKRLKNKHRVKRDAKFLEGELARKVESDGTKKIQPNEGVLENNASRQTTATTQTVGSLLAKIPGILEVHEQSYNEIVNQISGVGTSIASAIGTTLGSAITQGINTIGDKIGQGFDQMHSDAQQMQSDAKAQAAAQLKVMVKQEKTLQNGIDRSEKTLHDGMHNLVTSLTDEENNINGLKDVLHNGLDTLSEKIGTKSKLEEAVHDGFDLLAGKLSEKGKLETILHNGLDTLSEKMGTKSKLEEAVHDGFDLLAGKFSEKGKLETVIHDGLHDLTEQVGSQSSIDQILHNGLDGIEDALENAKNPVVNLPSSFGTSCECA